MQKNILEYLDRSAQRVPDKIAFYGETDTLTFRQLRRQAQAIGSRLAQLGSFRKPVAVFMDKQPRTIAAFLGPGKTYVKKLQGRNYLSGALSEYLSDVFSMIIAK